MTETLRRLAGLIGVLGLSLVACRQDPGPAPTPAQLERERVELSDGWRFLGSDDLAGAEAPGFDDAKWKAVSLPHTWARDEPRTYKAAWYRRQFRVEDTGRPTYLYFEGAAAIADVFVNGVRLGQHRGAYTRFGFDASPHVRPGDNLLAVRVSNDREETADCLPSGTERELYFVWGGLHRKVWLLRTPTLHLDPADHASPGVYVTPSNVTRDGADLEARVLVRNARASAARFQARARLVDAQDREVLLLRQSGELRPGARGEVKLAGHVSRPHLWAPGDPYLYTLHAELIEDGRPVDVVTQRIGFRDFRFDGSGFALNGKPILLRGVSKHQVEERSLSAVSDDEIRQDFALLRELGASAIRLAHYPHSELAYSLADESGILVIAENGHSNPGRGGPTGDAITREMVRQNYNHPSVVVWSVGNEADYRRVFGYARIAREDDPLRPIMYASNIGVRRKKDDDLSFVAQNVYRGWYRGQPWDFEEKAREVRYVSEAGGGSVVSVHTDYWDARHEVDVFEPEEYRQLISEVHGQVVFHEHPSEIPFYLTWLLRDFPIDKYKGVLNTKGLVTAGGMKKDAFHLYRSFLKPGEPLVHVTSKSYFLRRGDAHNGVKAYSNARTLTLTLNGEERGVRGNGEHQHKNGRTVANVFYWRTRLRPGRNEIVVRDPEGHSDTAVVYFAPNGAPLESPESALVQKLRSSNPKNPAFFIDVPVQEQWPLYYDFDGTADNTFDRIPEALAGSRFVATRRPSKPGLRTDVRFEVARPARVFVVRSEGPAPKTLTAAGFRPTEIRGEWRDDRLRLVPFQVFARDVEPGEAVVVPGESRDYVVLIRPPA